jgi:hypothetical protein
MKRVKVPEGSIKPCPFCGSDAWVYYVPFHSPFGTSLVHSVQCRSFKCTAKVEHIELDDCLLMWNTRVSSDVPLPCELGASKLPQEKGAA